MMTEARRKGVNGVPFVVIDGKWAVSGGQTAEVYTQVSRAGACCCGTVILKRSVLFSRPDLQKAGSERGSSVDATTGSAPAINRRARSSVNGARRRWRPGGASPSVRVRSGPVYIPHVAFTIFWRIMVFYLGRSGQWFPMLSRIVHSFLMSDPPVLYCIVLDCPCILYLTLYI